MNAKRRTLFCKRCRETQETTLTEHGLAVAFFSSMHSAEGLGLRCPLKGAVFVEGLPCDFVEVTSDGNQRVDLLC